MKLSTFMSEIDEVILKRGLDYFKDGHVLGTKVLSNGWVEVLVVGHDDYTVSIQLAEDGTILKANCACPYKGGPICKHEVAAFYSLSYSFTPKDTELERILKVLPVGTLLTELMKAANEHTDVYDHLMTYRIPQEEFEKFERRLETLVAKYVQFDHYVTGKAVQRLVDDLYDLLEEIKKFEQQSSFQLMAEMMLLLREECEGIEDQLDDSEAIFSDFLGELHARLQSIVFMTIDYHQDMDEIFLLLMNRLQKHDDWVDFELLDLLSEYAREPKRLQVITDYIVNRIEVVDEKMKSSLYKVWYELLTKYQEESLGIFLEQHKDVPALTEFRIEYLVSQGSYEKAIPLILELESLEENRFDFTWKVYRYKVYKKMNDYDEMKKLAYELCLNGQFQYYIKLKELYNDEFPFIYEALKLDWLKRPLDEQGPYLAMIEKEKDYEALLDYVRKDLHYIEKFASLLWDTHETEVHDLYEQYIKQETIQASNRSGYRRVCSILRRYRLFITEEAYRNLIQQLLAMYPKRWALNEELQKLLQEHTKETMIPSVEQLSIQML